MRLSAAQYAAFKQAIETGKWPGGERVAPTQRELMLQAVILYEQANPVSGPLTGVLDDQCKTRSPVSPSHNTKAAQQPDPAVIARDGEHESSH